MTELIYRIAKVSKGEENDSLKLTPGKWGLAQAALGDVVELHRPDGLIIIAPIRSLHHQGREIALVDLVSLELVPVGTEIRVRLPERTSVKYFDVRRQPGDKCEAPQFVQCSFGPGWRGTNLQFLGCKSRADVLVWFPMHPLLAKVRANLEKRKTSTSVWHHAIRSAKELEALTSSLRRLEQAADGSEERIIALKGDTDLLHPVTFPLLSARQFAWLVCPDCNADYKPGELGLHEWRTGSGMAAIGGSVLMCPREHLLIEVRSWIS